MDAFQNDLLLLKLHFKFNALGLGSSILAVYWIANEESLQTKKILAKKRMQRKQWKILAIHH